MRRAAVHIGNGDRLNSVKRSFTLNCPGVSMRVRIVCSLASLVLAAPVNAQSLSRRADSTMKGGRTRWIQRRGPLIVDIDRGEPYKIKRLGLQIGN